MSKEDLNHNDSVASSLSSNSSQKVLVNMKAEEDTKKEATFKPPDGGFQVS